jgi:tripartite-type tricarboxylate transporter receptor subunit TctC
LRHCKQEHVMGTQYQVFLRLIAVNLSAFCALSVWAQKPLTLLVGYPAGGSVDLVARTVAEPLGKKLGRTVVVENAAGAGGTIAAKKVVDAAPDGSTLLLGSGSEVTIARLYNAAVKYDGERDLSPIGLIGSTPMVLVASSKSGIKTVDELIAQAKREPKKLSFASSGIGTPLHISGELLNLKAGTRITHVPYRGAPQMVQDVLGGNIDLGVFVLSSALPHIQSGKMLPLGLTTPQRSRAAPQIAPLTDNAKLAGFDMGVWFGLLGPAKLPAVEVTRLNTALREVLQDPAVWRKLQDAGIDTQPGTPQQLRDFIRTETKRVQSVVVQAVAQGAN